MKIYKEFLRGESQQWNFGFNKQTIIKYQGRSYEENKTKRTRKCVHNLQ